MTKTVRYCDPSRLTSWVRDNVSGTMGGLLWDFLFGLDSGIPICCVLEYTVRWNLLKQPPSIACGYSFRDCPNGWVHCWFHRLLVHGKPVRRDSGKRERAGQFEIIIMEPIE